MAKKAVSAVPSFSKERIVQFERFARYCDLLKVALKDDQSYTIQGVENIIKKTLKKEVR